MNSQRFLQTIMGDSIPKLLGINSSIESSCLKAVQFLNGMSKEPNFKLL